MTLCVNNENAIIPKKLMFQKELTLIKQVYQKNAYFFIIGTLSILDLNLNHMFVINVMMF